MRGAGAPGLWLPAVVVAAAAILWSVRRIHDRRPWLAESMALAAMLLLSPVSWIHHWILVLPLLVASIRLVHEEPRRRGLLAPVLALSALLWFGAIWHVPNTHDREFHATFWQFVVGNGDVMLLVVTLAAVAWPWWSRTGGARPPDGGDRVSRGAAPAPTR